MSKIAEEGVAGDGKKKKGAANKARRAEERAKRKALKLGTGVKQLSTVLPSKKSKVLAVLY